MSLNYPRWLGCILVLLLTFFPPIAWHQLRGAGTEEFTRSCFKPYVLASIRQGMFSSAYRRYFTGLNLSLYSGEVSFLLPGYTMGFGARLRMEELGLIHYDTAELFWGSRLWRAKDMMAEAEGRGYFWGIHLALTRRSYITEDFQTGEPDPLLERKKSSSLFFSTGIGGAFRGQKAKIGLFLDSLGVKEGTLHLKPGGELEYMPFPALVLSCDLVWTEQALNWSVGAEYGLTHTGFSIDYHPFSLTLTGAFRPTGRNGLELRYDFTLPVKMGFYPTQRFVLSWRSSPLPPIWPNLVVRELELLGKPISGRICSLRVLIANEGRRRAKDFEVTILADDSVYTSLSINTLKPQGELSRTFPFVMEHAKRVKIEAVADRAGKLLESERADNIKQANLRFFPPPAVFLRAENDTLTLIQKIDIIRDEPLVPLVFFDKGSAELPERAKGRLKEIARRLKNNPDLLLEILGYADRESDGVSSSHTAYELALARAKSVKLFLDSIALELSPRTVVVTDGYDYMRKRAKKQDFEGTRKGRKFIAEENRRVELRIRLQDGIHSIDTTNFQPSAVIPLLERNPHLNILVVAYGKYKRKRGFFDPLLAKAKRVSDKLKAELPQTLSSRVCFAHKEDATREGIDISLTASSMLYDPIVTKRIAKAYKPAEEANEVLFYLSVESPQGLSGFKLEIRDDEGKKIRSFEGKIPPDVIAWDWRDERGDYPLVWRRYTAIAKIVDSFGLSAESSPYPLTIELKRLEESTERLVLSEYIFGGILPAEDYQFIRLHKIAEEVLNEIKNERGLLITIEGHTDIVGVKEGNIRLSERRAEATGISLLQYIGLLAGLESDDEVRDYLEARRCRITWQGWGADKPYTAMRYSDGKFVREVIGDNTIPEGRVVNRRVEILLESKGERWK